MNVTGKIIVRKMILLWLYISNASPLIVDLMKSEWRLHEIYHADRESIKASEIERKVSEN